MADTLTPNIKLTNQTEGGNNNTWGSIADANFERIDNKMGDATSITTTGGTTTLSDTQEIVAIIDIDGTLVSNAVIEFSGRGGFWLIRNATTGDYTLTCKVVSQTGVVIPQGGQRLVFCDGTDIVLGNTESAAAEEVTVASASTCDILAAGSEFVAISGTTTITSFGTGANAKRFVRATGAFKITHHATTLICPGGQDIVAAAGDTFIVVSNASSAARIYSYQRAAEVPATVPIGAVMDYAGTTAPSFWLFCYGQTLVRTEYPALFAAIGTTFGSTDSSNFKLPDCRGRIRAGKDNMGGTAASRITTAGGAVDGATLGAVGGSESVTLLETNLPTHTHSFSATTSEDGAHTHTYETQNSTSHPTGTGTNEPRGGHVTGTTSEDGEHTHTVSGTTGGAGSDTAVKILPPTMIFNTIIFAGV